MVDRPGQDPGPIRRWHRLLEHYTPDGRRGRLLLAAIAGPAAIWFSGLAVFGLFPPSVRSLLGTVVTGAIGFPLAILTIVVLWPIYLSMIGHIESADAYPPAASRSDEWDAAENHVETVKRRYEAGEISESELEQELEAQLDAGSDAVKPGASDRTTGSQERDRQFDRT